MKESSGEKEWKRERKRNRERRKITGVRVCEWDKNVENYQRLKGVAFHSLQEIALDSF